ncbi:MAG: glycosyltransferase [Chromatiales bacterium]|jgi:GT2 family glycosyltransferase
MPGSFNENTAEEKQLDLSVVIPAYNNRGHLQDIVSAIISQNPAVKEIIVSHSGEYLPALTERSEQPLVTMLHSDFMLHSGAARNRGAQLASGKWLAFIDDDVIPATDWTANIRSLLNKTEEKECFVGSIDYDTSGGYWGMCLWFIEFGSVHKYMPSRIIEGGASANMLVSRKLFDATAGFPEKVNRSVDVEFMAKCRTHGGITKFHSDIVVAHRNIGGFRHCLTHAASLGGGSARIRCKTALKADITIKYPLTIPFLFPARLSLLTYRVLRRGKGYRACFTLLLPGIALALLAWTIGFARFVLKPETTQQIVSSTK